MIKELEEPKGNLGILVGGGPAPGLNGVISAVTIEARRHNLTVYGIRAGYKWLVQDDEEALKKNVQELRIADVSRIHFDGGSILRTSRTNPVKTKNGIENAVKNLRRLNIKYMVTIGGDDTAYGASEIARAAGGEIKFAHVPKTIDNDLPLPNELPTFGYQTARDLGALLVKNLMEDSRTTDRWYIVVAMGRHSGHLALGIAKSAGSTLSIIPEEFGLEGDISLKRVCDIFETSIIKRKAMGHNHGVLVLAEGVATRLSPEELKTIPGVQVEYDDFGNLRLAEIELGKIVKQIIEKRFADRGDKMPMVEINIGYVLRCADPIPFDQEYTRDLGYQAVRYLLSKDPVHRGNAMICVEKGALQPLLFEKMIDPVTKKTAIRFVDIESESYKIAKSYMVRLEERDLHDQQFLRQLAGIAKIGEKEFVEKFGYLVR
jgi:6-phosphofructokinase